MNRRIKLITRMTSLLGLGLYCTSFAANITTDKTDNSQKISQETAALEKQMQSLQIQLAALEQEQAVLLPPNQAPKAKAKPVTQKPVPAKLAPSVGLAPNPPPIAHATVEIPTNRQGLTAYQQNVQPAGVEPARNVVPYGEHTLANVGGFAVITSPYLHPESAYDGGDLIVNYSSINKDASILRQRQSFQNAMRDAGFGMPASGSLLELSGEVQGQFYSQRDFNKHHSDVLDLTDAELDMQALVNRWFTAFMSFSYSNSPTASGNRTFNSNLALDAGFFTFGDLNRTPWRVTMGQMYVPFGQFNSFLVSDPYDKTIFRTKGRPLLIGYSTPGTRGFSGALYGFVGDTRVGKEIPGDTERRINDHVNQYGVDLNYNFKAGPITTDLGASLIRNIADSNGMQSNGAIYTPYEGARDDVVDGFQGFAQNSGSQVLKHAVPGADARAKLSFSNYILIAEYATATTSFSSTDLTYNDHGAKPSAYHLEGVHSFDIYGKPSSIAVGYDHSSQALALNVPRYRVAAALNCSIWRNTMASVELRHDTNYGDHSRASGADSAYFYTTGSSSNALTGQFQVYF